MRAKVIFVGLLILTGAGDQRRVLNNARIFEQPKYWARQVGTVQRSNMVTVLKDQGAWVKVRGESGEGYVPRSAFEDNVPEKVHFADTPAPQSASAAQSANAARGFSREINEADVKKSNLQEADGWLSKYEGSQEHAPLQDALAAKMPAFVKDGHLGGAP